MEKTIFSYPRGMRVRVAFDLLVWVWFFATGIYFLTVYHLPSWRAVAGVGIAVGYLGFMAYQYGQRQLLFAEVLELSPQGLRRTRWGTELALIPWSEFREIRCKGRYQDLLISSTVSPRPFVVSHYLEGFDEFQETLPKRVVGASPDCLLPPKRATSGV